jgi:enoyl-CoA hydratase/carnithine racemase
MKPRENEGILPLNDKVFGWVTRKRFENFVVVDLACQCRGSALPDRIALDLADACEQISWDEQVRVVVLSFDGSIHCEPQEDSDLCDGAERHSLVGPIAGLRQPVIAAINGDAVDLGLELALACDIRIGTENARFGLTRIREGRMPSDGGTQRLPRLIGRGKALHMILTGEMMDGAEALQCGLVNRIVPARELKDEVVRMAGDMAENSPVSLTYVKEALYKGLDLTLGQGLGMELDLYLHLFTTSDRTEGIEAFREKRRPKFEGQ